ncbi:glycoside hydrolase family 16 protein [Pseudonocardia phyllosphaerae]|uniref:glycoside hydrolase family 16 protein n=1 Tax=Pseudonocardia phyllosphaerae TaxID=3390502 RepID=UPI00397C4146
MPQEAPDRKRPDTAAWEHPDPEPEPRSPRRWPHLVGAFLAGGTLVGLVAAAANLDLLGDGNTGIPSTSPSSSAPGGVRGQERPGESGTLDPSQRIGTEAAVRGGWKLVDHDEFDGSALDTSRWSPYTGETTGGVGRHKAENLSVRDGQLVLTSRGLTSAGLAWQGGQTYGRWEIRAKTNPGWGYGDVALLWPDAEDWPEGGEVNFMEIPKGDRSESHSILHFGEDNSQVGHSTRGDFTQWHTYATEWTPDHVAYFIDGQEVFRSTDPKTVPERPMHLAIQQDIGPYGNDWIPARDSRTPDELDLQVDWVRIYAP